jgi:hypothetical protein
VDDYLKKLIYELLFYRRTTLADTEWFMDKGHNSFLVPQFDLRVGDILDSFEKYRRISYDTQGVRDHGIDVLLRYGAKTEKQVATQYIGFQIKSYNDLEERDWLTKLKAQILDAKNHVSMEDFFIVLCTDARLHLEKLRFVQAELSKDGTTHVVRPEFSKTFYQLSPQRIGAFIKTQLSEEDLVYRLAANSLSDLTPHQAAIVIELVVGHFTEGLSTWNIQDLRQREFLVSTYASLPNLPIEYFWDEEDKKSEDIHVRCERDEDKAWISDLEEMDCQFVRLGTRADTVSLIEEGIAPLAALALDGRVRYGYTGDDLRRYLMETLLADKLQMAETFRDGRLRGDDDQVQGTVGE